MKSLFQLLIYVIGEPVGSRRSPSYSHGNPFVYMVRGLDNAKAMVSPQHFTHIADCRVRASPRIFSGPTNFLRRLPKEHLHIVLGIVRFACHSRAHCVCCLKWHCGCFLICVHVQHFCTAHFSCCQTYPGIPCIPPKRHLGFPPSALSVIY